MFLFRGLSYLAPSDFHCFLHHMHVLFQKERLLYHLWQVQTEFLLANKHQQIPVLFVKAINVIHFECSKYLFLFNSPKLICFKRTLSVRNIYCVKVSVQTQHKAEQSEMLSKQQGAALKTRSKIHSKNKLG